MIRIINIIYARAHTHTHTHTHMYIHFNMLKHMESLKARILGFIVHCNNFWFVGFLYVCFVCLFVCCLLYTEGNVYF